MGVLWLIVIGSLVNSYGLRLLYLGVPLAAVVCAAAVNTTLIGQRGYRVLTWATAAVFTVGVGWSLIRADGALGFLPLVLVATALLVALVTGSADRAVGLAVIGFGLGLAAMLVGLALDPALATSLDVEHRHSVGYHVVRTLTRTSFLFIVLGVMLLRRADRQSPDLLQGLCLVIASLFPGFVLLGHPVLGFQLLNLALVVYGLGFMAPEHARFAAVLRMTVGAIASALGVYRYFALDDGLELIQLCLGLAVVGLGAGQLLRQHGLRGVADGVGLVVDRFGRDAPDRQPAVAAPGPGWHIDPDDPTFERYFDGTGYTPHRRRPPRPDPA